MRGKEEYATVAMRFSLNDRMVARDDGRLIEQLPSEATELLDLPSRAGQRLAGVGDPAGRDGPAGPRQLGKLKLQQSRDGRAQCPAISFGDAGEMTGPAQAGAGVGLAGVRLVVHLSIGTLVRSGPLESEIFRREA